MKLIELLHSLKNIDVCVTGTYNGSFDNIPVVCGSVNDIITKADNEIIFEKLVNDVDFDTMLTINIVL